MALGFRSPSGFRKSKSASAFVATRAMRYPRSPGKAAALYGHVITDRPLRGFSRTTRRAAESGERTAEAGKRLTMMGIRTAVRARFRQAPSRIPPGTSSGSCLRLKLPAEKLVET